MQQKASLNARKQVLLLSRQQKKLSPHPSREQISISYLSGSNFMKRQWYPVIHVNDFDIILIQHKIKLILKLFTIFTLFFIDTFRNGFDSYSFRI